MPVGAVRRPAVAWASLALAMVLLVANAILTVAGNGDLYEVLAGVVIVIPFVGVGALIACRQPSNPIGWLLAGIVLRYRLYEIDRVISRTLVYAAVTIVLGAAYLGLVLLGQAVFSSFACGSNLAIAASTLVVAALFLPVRGRVQRVIDRRFYRRRYDAQRTLKSFGARLREEIDFCLLERDLQAVVTETMQPEQALSGRERR